MLIDLRSKGISGKDAEQLLGEADITVNKNMVPFDDRSPMITSGIRVGTAAITTRGLKTDDIEKVVQWIDTALMSKGDAGVLAGVKSAVNQFMLDKPLFTL
jgi:glycine hydroxymethyltransferase